MKITSVSNTQNYSIEKNIHDNTFKGIKLDTAVKNTKVPNNFKECRDIWNNYLDAVKNESTLQILDLGLFEDLLEYKGYNARYLSGFFFEHNIESKSENYSVDVAKDNSGTLMRLGKDDIGSYVEFNSKEGVRRVGVTYPIGNYRYNYYQEPGIYVDFHNSENGNGRVRQITTAGSDTKYFDKDGKRDFFGSVKDLYNKIFK